MTDTEYTELETTIENRRKLKEWEADYNRNRQERLSQAQSDNQAGVGPRSVAPSVGVFRMAGQSFHKIQRTVNGCFS